MAEIKARKSLRAAEAMSMDKGRANRELAVEASAFLPISVAGALALFQRGDTVQSLRARIEENLAGEPAPLPTRPGVKAAAERQCQQEPDAGVLEHRRQRALRHSRKSAVISDCGCYRYRLDRVWTDEPSGRVVWVMLNPSTADADNDDATLRRCLGFSASWGYGALTVVNLFAFRTTYPTELARQFNADPVGPACDQHIDAALAGADLVICGWGNSVRGPVIQARSQAVLARIRAAGHEPRALAITSDGEPRHPVRLRADIEPQLLADLRARSSNP